MRGLEERGGTALAAMDPFRAISCGTPPTTTQQRVKLSAVPIGTVLNLRTTTSRTTTDIRNVQRFRALAAMDQFRAISCGKRKVDVRLPGEEKNSHVTVDNLTRRGFRVQEGLWCGSCSSIAPPGWAAQDLNPKPSTSRRTTLSERRG